MPSCKKNFKDLDKYYEYMRDYRARYRAKTGSGKYPPRPYTPQEDKEILAMEIPDRELAKKLHRSVTAIWHRRSRLRGGS